MAKEIESKDEEFDEIQESDDTDWKSETIKLREKAIRQREKTKELRDALKERETKLAEFEKSKPVEKVEQKKSGEFGLLERAYLHSLGYKDKDEIAVFEKWAKDTGKELTDLADHPFIKTEIETLRTAKANQDATSDIKGEGGTGSAEKNTPEYWIAKGVPPTPDQVPDRKTRAQVTRAMVENLKGGRQKFYNGPK